MLIDNSKNYLKNQRSDKIVGCNSADAKNHLKDQRSQLPIVLRGKVVEVINQRGSRGSKILQDSKNPQVPITKTNKSIKQSSLSHPRSKWLLMLVVTDILAKTSMQWATSPVWDFLKKSKSFCVKEIKINCINAIHQLSQKGTVTRSPWFNSYTSHTFTVHLPTYLIISTYNLPIPNDIYIYVFFMISMM